MAEGDYAPETQQPGGQVVGEYSPLDAISDVRVEEQEPPKPRTLGEAMEQPDAEEGQDKRGWISDMAVGAVGGVRDGIQEMGETIQWAGEGIGKAIKGGHDVYIADGFDIEWLTDDEAMGRSDIPDWQKQDLFGDTIVLPEVPENDTTAGSIVRGTTQFLAGYGIFGKTVKTVKGAMAAGAATDFVAFDEHEKRFSDFLRDKTGLRDPITEYLSADESDSVLEGKLKNTLEGMGLGIAAEGVMRIARSIKTGRKIKAEEGPEAAARYVEDEVAKAVDEAPEAMQLELFDEDMAPRVDPVRPASKGETPAPETPSGKKGINETIRIAQERRERARSRPDFDVSGFRDSIQREMGLVRGGSMPDPNRTLDSDFLNLDKMDSDISTRDYLRMAMEEIPDEAVAPDGTFKQWEEDSARFIADSVDGTVDDIRAYARRTAEDSAKQTKTILAGKKVLQSMSREIETLAYRIDSGFSDNMPEDMAKMVRLQSNVMELAADVKSIQKSAAQTTAAGRIRTSDVVTGQQVSKLDIQRQLDDEIAHAGGNDKIRQMARDIVNMKETQGGASGVLRVASQSRKTGFWDVVNEVRINGLLSGPTTQMINIISNGLQMGVLPAEKIVGGAVTLDARSMKEGFRQYVGLASAVRDSVRMAALAGAKGRNILDPEAAILEANGVDYRAIRSGSDNKAVRSFINGLGASIRIPSRGLTVGDEFFKQMNYRSDLSARIQTEVYDMVADGRISRDQAADMIARKMEAGFNRHGGGTDMKSLSYAREATFTDELLPGAMKKVQDFSNAHPSSKLLIPFIRTPTNLVVAAGQRNPITFAMSKRLRDDFMSGDPSLRSRSVGKVALGSAMLGSFVLSAQEGKITGGGPVDPEARRRLLATGWRPYSYVRNNADGTKEYIEFNRLDPYAMMAGITADVIEIGGQLGEMEMEELSSAAVAAVANNIGSKTWLQGVTQAAQAYSDPDMYMEHYLRQMATTFMPYSSASRWGRKQDDPAMREVESLVDAFKNTIPGYSKELPARRSMITGEPILYPQGFSPDGLGVVGEAFASVNPIKSSLSEPDFVLDELVRLGEGVISKPSKKIMDVELTPEQYEDYIELHGKIVNPNTGRRLYDELEAQMRTAEYDIERRRVGDPSDTNADPRLRTVRRVVTGYRDMAKAELMARHPDLAAKIEDLRIERANTLRGRRNGTGGYGPTIEIGD